MRAKLLKDGDQRIHALVFETGADPMAGIRDFARRHGIVAASFQAIGAFEHAVLGFFDFERRDYLRIEVAEQTEVVSLTGNVALKDGEPVLHVHAVLGKRDGQAVAGHLLEATVRPTLEVMLSDLPAHLARAHDEATGLPLLSSGTEADGSAA
ncbi:MAG TPA: PPC domain-containing DNA-binding protein [Alphaproteobacteria bacterium]|nr:PPC domain-containing DNA-binding protein [Alphaproteobacteria bacterium]